jgi:hypothetical protein
VRKHPKPGGLTALRRLRDGIAWPKTMQVRLRRSCCGMQIRMGACMNIPTSPPGHDSNRKQGARSSSRADSSIRRSSCPRTAWITTAGCTVHPRFPRRLMVVHVLLYSKRLQNVHEFRRVRRSRKQNVATSRELRFETPHCRTEPFERKQLQSTCKCASRQAGRHTG